MDRRSLLIGASCIAAVGVAELLRPRTVAALKGKHKLADIIPRRFVGWTSTDSSDIVIPKVPDSLADRLYSDMVGRIYSPVDDDKVQPKIMLLAAYGAAQTDMLQLHRPESCYPAIGFTITHRRLVNIPLSRKVMLPAVELTAVSGDRVEDIVYWTRLGEYRPQTSGAQRRD
ncbi:MAG: exosortase C-terminal domain/associated protein EpsI, partial [Sphingobium sp.]